MKRIDCNHDCDNCGIITSVNKPLLDYIFNRIDQKHPEINLQDLLNQTCPNLTVCSICHIDDFCHNDCEIIQLAKNPWEYKELDCPQCGKIRVRQDILDWILLKQTFIYCDKCGSTINIE